MILVLLLCVLNAVNAWSLSLTEDSPTDVIAIQKIIPVYQRSIYTKAARLIDEAKSSPSCVRSAAENLIESCQSLDVSPSPGSPKDVKARPLLDTVKSTYAARLALCELAEAQVAVPVGCRAFIPSPTKRKKRKEEKPLDYDKVNDAQLTGCLKELAGLQQHWISYSNAKQNAIVMCQAVRHEIERDELLDLHRSMAGVMSDLDFALATSVEQTSQQLAEQKKFADAVRRFQSELLQDLEQAKSESRTFMEYLYQNLGSASQAFLGAIHKAGEAVHEQVEQLNRVVSQSAKEAETGRDHVRDIVDDAIRGTTEIANSQLQQWQATNDLAKDLQSSLERVNGEQVHGVVKMIESLSRQLETSNSIVASIHQRQSMLDESLDNLHRSVARLQDKAIVLSQTQEQHADVQLSSFQAFNSEMHVALGSIANASAALANFHAEVNETSQSFQSIFSLWFAGSLPLRWMCLALLMLVNTASAVGLIVLSSLCFMTHRTAVKIYGVICCLELCLWLIISLGFPGIAWLLDTYTQPPFQKDAPSTAVHRLCALGLVMITIPLALYTRARVRAAATPSMTVPNIKKQYPHLFV